MPGFNVPVSDACHDQFAVSANSPFQGPPNSVETARKHRYSLDVLEPLGDRRSGLLLFLAKATRPAVDIDEIVIHSGQDEIYRPGKHRHKAVEFTFYERLEPPTEDQAAKFIYDWWAKSMIWVEQSVHGAPGDYLKTAELSMLDGIGYPVWKYMLYDSWPSKVSPSDLSYADSDIAEIAVTLRFAKCREFNQGA